MSFNLTSQQIKDTYEQLAQVSASLLVNGTGSLSPIVTSSIINFPTEVSRSAAAAGFGAGGGGVSEATFTAYTSSNDSKVNSLTSATSSYALKTAISGAFTSTSASLAANIATNTINIGTLTSATSSYAIKTEISGAFTSTSASLAANIATNTSNISTQTSRVNSLEAATSSYAVKSSNNTFSGTQTFLNIGVTGTASFAYVQQVTGSAVVIGEEFIILNTALPAARYAGLKVYDTGSTESTASFLFDGLLNDWFYQYSGSDGTDYGVVLFGPEYDTAGNPLYPTANQIQKGTGGHHLTGSNITDNGTLVSVSTPFTATQITASTGFKGSLDGNATTSTSASFATTASHALNVGLVSGTGTDSIRSSNNLTTTPANAYGQYSIVLGEAASGDNRTIVLGKNATAPGDDGISIGNGATANGARAIAIGEATIISGNNAIALGYQSAANTDSIAIGTGASVSSINSIAIGNQADSQQPGAIAIGLNVETTSSANEINIGNRFKFNGVSSIFLSGSVTGSGGFKGNLDGNATTATTSLTASSGDTFNIRTSLTLGSLVPTFVSSGSATGSLIDNIHPAIASSSAQIKHIVTLNQNQYSAITGSDDTLYIITDSSASVVTNLTITGELALSGSVSSEVTTLTIASSTASVDLSTSNFFQKSLTAATFIANPTNAKPGSTYTFQFDSGSLIANFGTDYRFVDGTNPTLSNGQDIVTFVSFLSGSAVKLYGTGLANFS